MSKRMIKRLTAVVLSFSLLLLTVLPLMGTADELVVGESGGEPICTCDMKCSATTPNLDCLACALDVSNCTGKELEAPKCFCDIKCTKTTPNMDCPICALDVSGCNGKEQEPYCICTNLCTEEQSNPDCPVCSKDYIGCKGVPPLQSEFSIDIVPPTGWKTKETAVEFVLTDQTGAGFEKVEVKIEKNGNWQDVTESLIQKENEYFGQAEIAENSTIYVSVTGKDEKVYEKSRYIECFDRTAPTVRAGVSGKLLRVQAEDDLSGVAAIYVDGEKFTDLVNETLDIGLQQLNSDAEEFAVQAVDKAGNQSRLILVKNPIYKELPKEQPEEKEEQKKEECIPQAEKEACPERSKASDTKPSVSSNAVGSSTSNQKDYTKTSVPATVPKQTEQREEIPLTPNGQATVVDHATGADGKEFFTITTADNNVFYLIVDRQREEENVYFLNAVTETDLLSLAQADEQPELILEPEEEPTCSCTQKCEVGDVNTLCPVCKENRKACVGEVPEEPEPEPKESNAGLILFVVLTLAVGGVVGGYFKIYRPKQEFVEDDDGEEEESEEFGTETINEDEEENQPEETTEDVAYYDDYPDEEPLEE
ncbi:MAG: DUF4366 domain-containing protein [Clostridium sp.]|nr:DUF4366 domain-containing protein [Clostridium sp.]